MTKEKAESELTEFFSSKFNALHQRVSPCVYHYTSAVSMMSIVKSGKIRAYNIDSMNDYTEVRLAASVFRATIELARANESNDHADKLWRVMLDEIKGIGLSRIFLTSYCENGDDKRMWNLYAEKGSGFSFAFLPGDLQGPAPMYYFRCNYSMDELIDFCNSSLQTARRILLSNFGEVGDSSHEEFSRLFFKQIVWFSTIFKLPVWSHEQEWRLPCYRTDEIPEKNWNGRPYIELPVGASTRFPIRAICAGPNADYETAIVPLQQLLNEVGYDGVPIHRSVHR